MTLSQNQLRWAVGVLAVVLILAAAVTYSVRERHAGVVTRFGKPARVTADAGLHAKLPWPLERATIIDMRRRMLETRLTEMLTRDKKNVILLTYAVWRVDDPLRFFRSVGSLADARAKLDGLLTNAKIGVLGRFDLDALTSTDESTLRVAEMEAQIRETANETAREEYGLLIDHVGFKRLSLPEENTSFVFDQMRAERRQFAARFRAEGKREASRIRAETDLEKAEILAEARETAARTRGEADAEAARIYAEAHGLDPELYRFLRRLESLEKVLKEDSTLILRTDSEPFSLLEGQDR
jgi:membrane protease subunit HflC